MAYELQTWEHRTGDTGYSSSPNDDDDDALLRTPCAAEAGGGPLHPDVAKERGQTLRLTGQILAHTGHLLPTPTRQDGANDGGPSQFERNTPPLNACVKLLPTPSANIGSNGGSQNPDKRRAGNHSVSIQDVAEHETDWGRFAPAIFRWAQELGRPAPAPTVPDGRNGKHRLSAPFVEWMMGLPEGWVTDVEISRNDQLKALGNGVVPQQCTAALRDMLAHTNAATAAA